MADGTARAALREAGVKAALALAYIAHAPDASSGGGQLTAFWDGLNAPGTPLLSTAVLTRLPPEEAHIGAELAQVLLLQVGKVASVPFCHHPMNPNIILLSDKLKHVTTS